MKSTLQPLFHHLDLCFHKSVMTLLDVISYSMSFMVGMMKIASKF